MAKTVEELMQEEQLLLVTIQVLGDDIERIVEQLDQNSAAFHAGEPCRDLSWRARARRALTGKKRERQLAQIQLGAVRKMIKYKGGREQRERAQFIRAVKGILPDEQYRELWEIARRETDNEDTQDGNTDLLQRELRTYERISSKRGQLVH